MINFKIVIVVILLIIIFMIDFPVNNPLEESPLASQIDPVGRYRTIVDANGNNVIDDTGLVSTNNFISSSYNATGQITTNSTSFTDVSGSGLTFSLGRTTNVLILLTAGVTVLESGQDRAVRVAIVVDGSAQTPEAIKKTYNGDSSNTWFATVSSHILVSLAAGSHTIKIQWKVDNGGATGYMIDRRLTYIILGK